MAKRRTLVLLDDDEMAALREFWRRREERKPDVVDFRAPLPAIPLHEAFVSGLKAAP